MEYLQLTQWARQAVRHWKEFQPTKYRQMEKEGTLYQAAQEAADLTAREMDRLTDQGFREDEAWVMVRENYLFSPEEKELKDKEDQIGSEAGSMFNEIMQLQNMILQGEEFYENGTKKKNA